MSLPADLFDIKSRFLVWAMKKKPKGSKVLQPRYFELKRERHTVTLGWYKDDRSKKMQKEPRDLRQVVSLSIPSRSLEGGGDLSVDLDFPDKTYTIVPKAGDPASIRFVQMLQSLKPIVSEGWLLLCRKPTPGYPIETWEERHVRLNGSYITLHKTDKVGAKALQAPVDLCNCRILKGSRMDPCAKDDPTSIDIVKITGVRQDGAVRGKAVLTIRQTMVPTSRVIAEAILRFSKMLTERPSTLSSGDAMKRREETIVNYDSKSSSEGVPPPPPEKSSRTSALKREAFARNRTDSPPMPSADALAMMSDSDDDDEPAPLPPKKPAHVNSPVVKSAARRASIRRESGTSASMSVRDDPKMAPYAKMLRMHMPEVALRHKMRAEGISEAKIDAFLNGGAGSEGGGGAAVGTATISALNHEVAECEFDFEGDPADDEQLPVKAGERVIVLEKFDDGWWNVENQNGRKGIVPADFMKSVKSP